jgi:DMSO/TMAO reductase YedYZ molybdopterin-dependent catalytic subunit
MKKPPSLPPGQKELDHHPRFGLWQYANRIREVRPLSIVLSADSGGQVQLDRNRFAKLARVEQISDFHCVTTWSVRDLHWSGYRFSDFYHQIAQTELRLGSEIRFVRFVSDDGYRAFMHLDDLLKDDVLLADTLDGAALNLEHGGPMRLVAPSHYGFKSAKHLCSIHFCRNLDGYRSPALHWHEHPRARVALEERGTFLPTWFWRMIGPPALPTVLYVFRRAAAIRAKSRTDSSSP